MIPHPSVPALLARHGHTAEGRAAARHEIVDYMLDQARREAALAGRSLSCQGGHHARNDQKYGRVGCTNDGSRCVCECHDPKESGTVQP